MILGGVENLYRKQKYFLLVYDFSVFIDVWPGLFPAGECKCEFHDLNIEKNSRIKIFAEQNQAH